MRSFYGVETRTLNQSVKRNADRFPEDFMFQLTPEEAAASRSQIVILNGRRGQNIKFLPHAFTEHGAIQAANILNSPRAVTMGIHVVRASRNPPQPKRRPIGFVDAAHAMRTARARRTAQGDDLREKAVSDELKKSALDHPIGLSGERRVRTIRNLRILA